MTEPARKESGSRTQGAEKSAAGRGRRRRAPYRTLSEAPVDAEAKRLCAVILEVLGGVRTPTDAAGALGVSVPRYYALEARALRGLLRACQRRSRGRKRSAEGELARLKVDLERLATERDRLQALLRASQRAMGLAAPQKPEHSKKKRKRRPQVRALRAARALEASGGQNPLECSAERREDAALVKG
jgi:hypothetical protein